MLFFSFWFIVLVFFVEVADEQLGGAVLHLGVLATLHGHIGGLERGKGEQDAARRQHRSVDLRPGRHEESGDEQSDRQRQAHPEGCVLDWCFMWFFGHGFLVLHVWATSERSASSGVAEEYIMYRINHTNLSI